jgi:hypothetical protein
MGGNDSMTGNGNPWGGGSLSELLQMVDVTFSNVASCTVHGTVAAMLPGLAIL